MVANTELDEAKLGTQGRVALNALREAQWKQNGNGSYTASLTSATQKFVQVFLKNQKLEGVLEGISKNPVEKERTTPASQTDSNSTAATVTHEAPKPNYYDKAKGSLNEEKFTVTLSRENLAALNIDPARQKSSHASRGF